MVKPHLLNIDEHYRLVKYLAYLKSIGEKPKYTRIINGELYIEVPEMDKNLEPITESKIMLVGEDKCIDTLVDIHGNIDEWIKTLNLKKYEKK